MPIEQKLTVKEFFDQTTWTLTYVAYDDATKDAVIIDPVWDYDPARSTLTTGSTRLLIDFIHEHGLKVHYILETHAHADHITGAQILKKVFGDAKVAIGGRITEVQHVFKGIFDLGGDFSDDGSQFDLLLDDHDRLKAGSLTIETISTPGHTPACSSYLIGDAVFTGDALFMPDSGTGRCDFPAGSAERLYHSVHERLYALPDSTRVFTGHDYQPGGRPVKFESTIGDEKRHNIHLKKETTKNEFIEFRNKRDHTLAAPKLLLPSIQININAGILPIAERNGTRYLKLPLTTKE